MEVVKIIKIKLNNSFLKNKLLKMIYKVPQLQNREIVNLFFIIFSIIK